MSATADRPLSLADPDLPCRLRDAFDQAGFTEAGVLQVLHAEELPGPRTMRQMLPLLDHRLRGDAPLHTLIRLFLLGDPISTESARRAVGPLEPLAGAGLLEVGPEDTRAAVQLCPSQGLILPSDWVHASSLAENHVVGAGGSSRTLAHLTIRRPMRRTLDLGTGCGYQAYRAAAHSDQVLAVDFNPRAVNLAAFGARLNRLANVECRHGNLFEPAAGQAFDLIVTNLPFVISPRSRYIFRDSGLPADRLCQDVIRTAPGYLQEGGHAQLLCNWVHLMGEDPSARLASWCAGTGCDAWALQTQTQDPADYASFWIRQTEGDDLGASASEFREWLAYFERERIEAISFGLITLRRRADGSNWFRLDPAPATLKPCGNDIARRFELQDFLDATRDDQALMAARLWAAPEVRWELQRELVVDSWNLTASRLHLVGGLAYRTEGEQNVVAVLTRCQGGESLGTILADIAQFQGRALDQVAPAYLPTIRRLVADGFLLPSAPENDPGRPLGRPG